MASASRERRARASRPPELTSGLDPSTPTGRWRRLDGARLLTDLAIVTVVRLLVSAVVIAAGFQAVSDDDFARVVIAQQWAVAPALDPTGTSWLPAPFWTYGSLFALFGRSLFVARAVAVLLGVGSALLVYLAARLWTERRGAALGAALVATLFPYGAVLGVAPLPELPTAALTLFAMVTACRTQARWRIAGAAGLFVACLSRYEPWIIAVGFAVLTGLDVVRQPQRRAGRVLAIGLALFGPALWLVHNRLAHGDALRFLGRVADYRQALGRSVGDVSVDALAAYPLALVQKEPELVLVALLLLAIGALDGRGRRAGSEATGASREATGAKRSGWRVLALALWLVVGLSLAAARGGVATHHPERALLTVWLLVSVFVGAALDAARTRHRVRARLLVVAGVPALVLLSATILRPWYARLDAFAQRSDEVTIGSLAGARVPMGERALLEVRDFGYFAVLAGSARPEGFVVDRELDPRRTEERSSFVDASTLCQRAAAVGARFAVGVRAPEGQLARSLGSPLEATGRWALWSLEQPCSLPLPTQGDYPGEARTGQGATSQGRAGPSLDPPGAGRPRVWAARRPVA